MYALLCCTCAPLLIGSPSLSGSQLARAPRPFPKLTIKPRPDGSAIDDIDSFEFSDFVVEGYKPHGAIKMKMAV